jgi:hypothetical protein
VIGAKVVFIPRIVERCQLIVQYSSLDVDFLSIKVISGKGKYGWKLYDLQLKLVTLECEVESKVKSFATPPSSGIKLSHLLHVPLVMETKDVIYLKPLRLGERKMSWRRRQRSGV